MTHQQQIIAQLQQVPYPSGSAAPTVVHPPIYGYGYAPSIGDEMAKANYVVKRQNRLQMCARCELCERVGAVAKAWSRCRAVQRRALLEFIDNPLAACPAARWLPEYPLLDWAPATQESGIIIGSDEKAARLVRLFVQCLRKHTRCDWPIYCADFGLSPETAAKLPVDQVIQVPGAGLHPMYRKPVTAMVAPFRRGIWYDTDILVRISPELALQELEESGLDLAIRRGEEWWKIRHRADNYHTGVFAYLHGSETLRQWASWAIHGDAVWVTAEDANHIRDEELFAELIRLYKMPVLDLSARHTRLPSEVRAGDFGMPEIPGGCAGDNWHYPGPNAKAEFRRVAEADLAITIQAGDVSWADNERTVVTGCDAGHEKYLELWHSSYAAHNSYPICFLDFGLSEGGRAVVRSWDGVTIVDCRDLQKLHPWLRKPLGLIRAAGQRLLWIDTDCEFSGDVGPAFPADDLLYVVNDHPGTRRIYPGMVQAGVIAFQRGNATILRWAALCGDGEAVCAALGDPFALKDQTILTHLLNASPEQRGVLPAVFNWSPIVTVYSGGGRMDHVANDSPDGLVITHYCSEAGKVALEARLGYPNDLRLPIARG